MCHWLSIQATHLWGHWYWSRERRKPMLCSGDQLANWSSVMTRKAHLLPTELSVRWQTGLECESTVIVRYCKKEMCLWRNLLVFKQKKKMRENSDLWDSERKKRLFPDPSEQAIRVETGFERQKPSKLSQLKTVAQACGKDQIKGIAFCSWQLIRISFVPPM